MYSEYMRNNHLKSIKGFFRSLKTSSNLPSLDYNWDSSSPIGSLLNSHTITALVPKTEVSESQHRRNMEKIELARLEQERETANNNLAAQHRVMIVTLLATFIALCSSVSAIFIALQKDTPPAPIVNVTPAQQAPPNIQVYAQPHVDNQSPEKLSE